MRVIAIWLTFFFAVASAETQPLQTRLSQESSPPLIAAGEKFQDVEALLAGVSRLSPVRTIAWSPDGSTLASGTSDAGIQLWDVTSGNLRRRLSVPVGRVADLSFGPRSTLLAMATEEGTVSIWDIESGTEQKLPLTSRVVAIDAEGGMLAAGSEEDGRIVLWDLVRNSEVLSLPVHSGRLSALAWSQNGVLASASWDKTVGLWDPARGGGAFRYLKGHTSLVRALAWSHDGSRLATGSSDRTIRLWDPATGSLLQRFSGHEGAVTSVAWSPRDGAVLSGSTDGTARLWDSATSAQLKVLRHRSTVTAVGWRPDDGGTFATGAVDAVVRIWDYTMGEELRRLEGHWSPTESLALADEAGFLAASTDRSIRLWDLAAGVERARFLDQRGVSTLALTRDGRYLGAGYFDGAIYRWDLEALDSGERRRIHKHNAEISALAWSRDGTILAWTARERSGRIRLLNVETGASEGSFEGQAGPVTSLAWSQISDTLVFASQNAVFLWDVRRDEGRRVFTLRDESIIALNWGRGDSSLLVGTETGRLYSWELGSASARPIALPTKPALSFVIQGGGRLLAVAGAQDGMIRIYQNTPESYLLSRFLLGGSKDTWISCVPEGTCLRYDDGSLLNQIGSDGDREPVPPTAADVGDGLLEVSLATRLLLNKTTFLNIRIHNTGNATRYWLRVQEAAGSDPSILFYPLPILSGLEPGDSIDRQYQISVLSDFENPRSRQVELKLEVIDVNEETTPIEPITLRHQMPTVDLQGLRWSQERSNGEGGWQLVVSIANTGEWSLPAVRVSARLANSELSLGSRTYTGTIEPQGGADLILDCPEEFEPSPGTRVSLVARQLSHPIYRWTFRDEVVAGLPEFWLRRYWIEMILLLIAASLIILLARSPLRRRLLFNPQLLVRLPLGQLQQVRESLSGWEMERVLRGSEVRGSWLDSAIRFQEATSGEHRCKILSDRLGVESKVAGSQDGAIWRIYLGQKFPLNVDICYFYQPPADYDPSDVRRSLTRHSETQDQVTLVVSPEGAQQKRLHGLAGSHEPWVAPSTGDLTELFLAAEPFRVLARLIADQVRRGRISPYQTEGGATKESAFFGRDSCLAKVIGRDPANYFVVGGRQMGKSSFLKALQRRYEVRGDVTCHYLVLSGDELVGRLSRAIGLARDASLEDTIEQLRVETIRRRLILIDEADAFIRAERSREYYTLRRLRSVSEEGRCHFILAGFWELFDAAVLDYQSPLKNFGEPILIGALEKEACREMLIEPMKAMNIRYASPDLVDFIMEQTGSRANLISLTCHEILQRLKSDDYVITRDDVAQALAKGHISDSLIVWQNLAGNEERSNRIRESNRLDRMLVYATIRLESFSLVEAIEILEKKGERVTSQRIRRSLERLTLAFILQTRENKYLYQVPLFKRMILAQEPDVLLERELSSEF